ncbi:hypothetical protein GCM10028796_46740 [Ramlibacter monticola]|uniref:Uncharacterized protein n=1 Tax=Ramlibacter monticola TaxID=1926872 RepID=A0A936Z3L7_9BURK|nr:hypothetical protein [Ramlibacter monticola]MBL0394299.1 hypothetical protein [Ramlibacter monticola]
MPTKPQRLLHRLVANPPPVRGLNSTDAVATMQPTDALEMDNFISADFGVTLREGWREYATNLGGPVRTVFSYDGAPTLSTASPVSVSVLFAATDDGIFDVEGGGNMEAETPMIALSGAAYAGRLSFVDFTTAGGKYLVACSETDGAFLFDGTTWSKMSSEGDPGPGVVTGVDPAMFVHVCAWKHRLMFVERGGTVAWILPVGSVGGAAAKFDFGPLLRSGGMLLALANWTMDAGAGIDDRLVALGSSGDLLVYEGTDPTNATQFRNVGVWYIGRPPVGRRCMTQSGGNVFVLTVFGVVPVAQVVQGGLDTLLMAGTEFLQQLRKIQDVLNVDFATLIDTVGWEIMNFPTKALMLIARPQLVVGEFVQYTFHKHALAWTRLLDIPAETFGRRLNEAYGGTDDGRVLQLFDGTQDGMLLDGTGAHEIRGRVTPAFNYFGDPTVLKQALMMRVNFLASSSPSYVLHVNRDFAVQPPPSAPALAGAVGSLWNHAMWDAAFWAGAIAAFGEWRSVEAMGFALAPTIYVASEQGATIANIEYMVKPGGPL